MSALTLGNLSKSFGRTEVVRGVDLQVEDGEFMVFVGPSGCGKTTLLRMVAGLETITGGELRIDGRVANDLPPVQRGMAMVFQSYALYPHMTVAENMGFCLKLRGASKAEIREAVDRAAEILRISHLLDRRPRELSGGQRQRVAIGRAIVRKPGVFLFDEPLSNLDAGLRGEMRVELARLHRELGSTMIYVTHDQVEAMTLGERIAVFNQGALEQVGPPMELYRNPARVFVAEFLGSPRINLLAAAWEPDGDRTRLRIGQGTLAWTGPAPADRGPVLLGVRPEHLEPAPGNDPAEGIPAVVEAVEHLGDTLLLHTSVAGMDRLVTAKLPEQGQSWHPGERLRLRPRMADCLLFGADGRRFGPGTYPGVG